MIDKAQAIPAADSECAALRAAIEYNMNLALKLGEMRAWKKHLATFDALFARAALKTQQAPTEAQGDHITDVGEMVAMQADMGIPSSMHGEETRPNSASKNSEHRMDTSLQPGRENLIAQGEDSARLDEAAAYRMWRDCDIADDSWFMQHLCDYLPSDRAPTAVEFDAAMVRVMKDRVLASAETGGVKS